MILGVDHLAMSCADILRSAEDFRARGHEIKFIEQDLPNPEEKKNFLKTYRPTHSIAYCRPKQGVAVELTAHGSVLEEASCYTFEGEAQEGGIAEVICRSSDAAASRIFWTEGLGFSETDGKTFFKAVFPHWSLKISFREDREWKPGFLDSAGFPCLAFLTRNIEEDLLRLGKAGAACSTRPFRMQVNHKSLKAAIVRGPGGEIVELLDINTEK